jgi:hypothetical protein
MVIRWVLLRGCGMGGVLHARGMNAESHPERFSIYTEDRLGAGFEPEGISLDNADI